MDGTQIHATEQRRQESEARQLARDSEPDSCHTRLDYVRVRAVGVGGGLWKVAYPNLAQYENTMRCVSLAGGDIDANNEPATERIEDESQRTPTKAVIGTVLAQSGEGWNRRVLDLERE
jgi:hypothetical protein